MVLCILMTMYINVYIHVYMIVCVYTYIYVYFKWVYEAFNAFEDHLKEGKIEIFLSSSSAVRHPCTAGYDLFHFTPWRSISYYCYPVIFSQLFCLISPSGALLPSKPMSCTSISVISFGYSYRLSTIYSRSFMRRALSI